MEMMILKQVLLAAGVNDAKVFEMLEKLASGGFSTPAIDVGPMSRFSVDHTQDVVRVSLAGTEETLYLLMFTEKTI